MSVGARGSNRRYLRGASLPPIVSSRVPLSESFHSIPADRYGKHRYIVQVWGKVVFMKAMGGRLHMHLDRPIPVTVYRSRLIHFFKPILALVHVELLQVR